MTCEDFQSDTHWIARRLGILKGDVDEALNVLNKLDLIEQSTNGWVKKSKKIRFPTVRSQAEIRNFHRQMIEQALKELNCKTTSQDFERRMISGITFSCNPKKIKKIKQKLNLLIHEIANSAMEGSCTEVYQINLQFFPLTKG